MGDVQNSELDAPCHLILDRYQTVEGHERYSVQHQIQALLTARMPFAFHLRAQDTVRNLTASVSYNKMFASEWYDGNTVLVVTKCNKLLQLDISTGVFTTIQTPKREPRPFSTRNIGWGNCGKHCIGFNPSRTMFATGGADPADVIIMDAVSMEPKVCLVGHKDWLFGTAWVTDSHVVSGSRDCSVGLWNVESENGRMPSVDPQFSNSDVIRYDENDGAAVFNRDFSARVRDVKFCDESKQLAVLTSDGGVKILDPFSELAKIKSFYIPDSFESVCMTYLPNKICVGCNPHAYLIDPRVRTLRHTVGVYINPNGYDGIRSIEIKDNTLSCGTGSGSLMFHDLRVPESPVTVVESHIQGRFEQSRYSVFPYRSTSFTPAIYSHKWDQSGTRIFFCGGPLACGLDGHFCGLYD